MAMGGTEKLGGATGRARAARPEAGPPLAAAAAWPGAASAAAAGRAGRRAGAAGRAGPAVARPDTVAPDIGLAGSQAAAAEGNRPAAAGDNPEAAEGGIPAAEAGRHPAAAGAAGRPGAAV